MNAEGKRLEISLVYGSSKLRNRDLRDIPDNQIHAIYGRMQQSGIFEEYETLKDSYVALFPNAHYVARRRANAMSVFELRRIIPLVIAEKEKKFPEGYQFTLMDWLNELEGKEQANESSNAQRKKQSNEED